MSVGKPKVDEFGLGFTDFQQLLEGDAVEIQKFLTYC